MQMRFHVLPRDIEPGDKVDRLDQDLNVVQATVKEVRKTRRYENTNYQITMREADEVPEGQRFRQENLHLRPFSLRPTQRIAVVREMADPNA